MARNKQWQEAYVLLQNLQLEGFELTRENYYTTLKLIAKFGRWEEALKLLQMMKNQGLPIDHACFTSAIAACSRAGKAAQSVALLRKMQECYSPNVVCYNFVIIALSKERMVEEAIQILREMQGGGVRPDKLTYRYLIQCCCENNRRDLALSLLQEMKELGIHADVQSYNHIIRTAEADRNIELVKQLLQEMRRRSLQMSPVTYNAAIKVCGENYSEADKLYQKALASNIYSHWRIPGDVMDLGGFSKSVSKAAVRHAIYEEQVKGVMRILTGPGVGVHNQSKMLTASLLSYCNNELQLQAKEVEQNLIECTITQPAKEETGSDEAGKDEARKDKQPSTTTAHDDVKHVETASSSMTEQLESSPSVAQ